MAITPNRLKPAEYLRTIHVATPESGTTVEQLTDPALWTHCARSLHVGDRIEVIPEDGTYFAELYVRELSKNSAKVELLRHHVLTEPDAVLDTDEFEIKWGGPNARYRVIRKKDKAILQDNFVDANAAKKWLANYQSV